jgi:Protein of unknown function (DUF2958)
MQSIIYFKPASELVTAFRSGLDKHTAKNTKLEAATALNGLRGFIGRSQLYAIADAMRGEEKQFFFEKMVEMAGIVRTMPKTHETDGQGESATVYLHYFMGGMDWYITEKDMETEQLQAFGMADLGYGGELGYISLVEVLSAGAELDLYFKPRPLSAITDRG